MKLSIGHVKRPLSEIWRSQLISFTYEESNEQFDYEPHVAKQLHCGEKDPWDILSQQHVLWITIEKRRMRVCCLQFIKKVTASLRKNDKVNNVIALWPWNLDLLIELIDFPQFRGNFPITGAMKSLEWKTSQVNQLIRIPIHSVYNLFVCLHSVERKDPSRKDLISLRNKFGMKTFS